MAWIYKGVAGKLEILSVNFCSITCPVGKKLVKVLPRVNLVKTALSFCGNCTAEMCLEGLLNTVRKLVSVGLVFSAVSVRFF